MSRDEALKEVTITIDYAGEARSENHSFVSEDVSFEEIQTRVMDAVGYLQYKSYNSRTLRKFVETYGPKDEVTG